MQFLFPQFLIFHKNITAQTFVIISFTPGHCYFFEKLKIVEKNLCKLNFSDGKVSHALKYNGHKMIKIYTFINFFNENKLSNVPASQFFII